MCIAYIKYISHRILPLYFCTIFCFSTLVTCCIYCCKKYRRQLGYLLQMTIDTLPRYPYYSK